MRKLALALLAAVPCVHAATVAVDVGHFLAEPGVPSARGRPEFQFNLDLAKDVEAAVKAKGMRTQLIGADGKMEHLSARTAAAARADFFLSLHHDSTQLQYIEIWSYEGTERLFSDRFAGFSLFVSHDNPDPDTSLRCASAIGAALRARGFTPSLYHADLIPGESKPFADKENGVHYYDNLIVLKTARSPAVLLEAGVIVNRDEELKMLRPETHKRMAAAVAEALSRCLAGDAAASGPAK